MSSIVDWSLPQAVAHSLSPSWGQADQQPRITGSEWSGFFTERFTYPATDKAFLPSAHLVSVLRGSHVAVSAAGFGFVHADVLASCLHNFLLFNGGCEVNLRCSGASRGTLGKCSLVFTGPRDSPL